MSPYKTISKHLSTIAWTRTGPLTLCFLLFVSFVGPGRLISTPLPSDKWSKTKFEFRRNKQLLWLLSNMGVKFYRCCLSFRCKERRDAYALLVKGACVSTDTRFGCGPQAIHHVPGSSSAAAADAATTRNAKKTANLYISVYGPSAFARTISVGNECAKPAGIL